MIRKLSCALLLALPISAQTNLLTNGSFESGPVIPTGQTEVTTTGFTIPGWHISANNVDYNSWYWQPSAGLRSISLHGTLRGRIEQTFTTIPGARYEVLFDVGVHGAQTMGVRVSTEDGVSPTYFCTGAINSRMVYKKDQRWVFTAADGSTTLRFDSQHLATDPNGPHLDNVRVFITSPAATFTTFGQGCVGTAGVPTLANTSRPVVGSTLMMQVTAIPTAPTNLTFGVAGFSRQRWASEPLPFRLDPYGAPQCNLLVSFNAIRQLEQGATMATWTIQVPTYVQPGLTVYMQAAVVDPQANPLGIVMSNAAEAVVGLH